MIEKGGLYPAVVKSYNAKDRNCTIEIKGMTDGAEHGLTADFIYPLGDKSYGNHATEIEVLAGDLVWVMFVNADARYPIVIGYRNPQVGNATGTRHYHHANISLTADTAVTITAPNINLVSDSLTHNGTNIGDTHTHGGVYSGGSNTSTPN